VAFDVLLSEGETVTHKPWEWRRLLLTTLVNEAQVPAMTISTVAHNPSMFETVLQRILHLGGEGIVAKRKKALYVPGSRRQDGWIKVKPQETTHAVVRGWGYGEGTSNRNRCGHLKVILIDTDVDTTVAYDSSTTQAQKLVGRTIELKHHGFLDSGKVRHPVFSRTRPDLELR
jgi:ATP-dependent DNA ligase